MRRQLAQDNPRNDAGDALIHKVCRDARQEGRAGKVCAKGLEAYNHQVGAIIAVDAAVHHHGDRRAMMEFHSDTSTVAITICHIFLYLP